MRKKKYLRTHSLQSAAFGKFAQCVATSENRGFVGGLFSVMYFLTLLSPRGLPEIILYCMICWVYP